MKFFLILFVVVGIAGLIDSGYLFLNRLKEKPLICPLNYDCAKVTESRWGKIFGVRNEILGMFFYVFIILAAFVVLFQPSLGPPLIKIMFSVSAIGLIFSLFLTSLQIFVIKNFCFYCLISAVLSLLIFINALFLIFRLKL